MDELEWRTEKRAIKNLKSYNSNPRKITDEQMQQLKKSIEKFNFVELPAINVDGTIVAGHQRIQALRILGRDEEEIEVRVPNRKLTEKEVEEYNIRSNKNTGEFDFAILSEAFNPEELREWGFSEEEVGNMNLYADDYSKEEFTELVSQFDDGKKSTTKNSNWFYVEYYNDEEKYNELKNKVKLSGKNLMDPEWFYEVIKDA